MGYSIKTQTAQIHGQTHTKNSFSSWTSDRALLTLLVDFSLISGQVVNTFKYDTKEAENNK